MESYLHLFYTPYVGPARFKQLLDYFGSAEEAASATNDAWQAAGMNRQVLAGRDFEKINRRVEQAISWSEEAPNRHILTLEDERYPTLLAEIGDAPAVLFVEGDCSTLTKPQIAMVGSRNPTYEGEENAFHFANHLSQLGFIISSGLAKGIDSKAHQGALHRGHPTIAVLGTGLLNIYPKRNEALSREIIEYGGALVSEFPLHTPPKASNFPRRNRIISGLSLGTLVVEATLKSGSLITARLSMEQNREVFAIPSSIHNTQAKGTHALIKNGAKLVESVEDILEELEGWLSPPSITIQTALNEHQKSSPNQRVDNLKSKHSESEDPLYLALATPKSIDQLIEQFNRPPQEITESLLLLELEGLIKSLAGGLYIQSHR